MTVLPKTHLVNEINLSMMGRVRKYSARPVFFLNNFYELRGFFCERIKLGRTVGVSQRFF